jgi:hypothetical protein
MIACSIIKKLGCNSITDIAGGFAEIRKINFEII